MHQSLYLERVRDLPTPGQTRSTLPRWYGAKVLTFIFAAALCVSSGWAAVPAAQEKQSQEKTKTVAEEPGAPPASQSLDLSDEVVRDVLSNLQRGIETQNLNRVLEVFDQQNMKDFDQFRDQMVAFFRRYDSVRFRYQLLQVTADKDQGFAIADIDMDADPSDILPTTQRRSAQMRFQMKRTPKGWRVVGLRPADFFNQ